MYEIHSGQAFVAIAEIEPSPEIVMLNVAKNLGTHALRGISSRWLKFGFTQLKPTYVPS